MKNVLIFNRFYLPGYRAGGPIKSIKNLVEQLGQRFQFTVVTGDRDSADTKHYPDIVHDKINLLGQSKVVYTNLKELDLKKIIKFVKLVEPDLIYLNSFFDTKFTLRVLLLRKLGRLKNIPVLLAPRGEFSPGAMELGRFKKKLYAKLLDTCGLLDGIVWHASSDIEASHISSVFPSVDSSDIFVALNLPDIHFKKSSEKSRIESSALRIVFLSRIAPKKNLHYALEVLKLVNVEIEFTILGPKAVPEYWEQCLKLIDELPNNIKVIWGGEVHPSLVHENLMQHDVFFFPTKGENYGHVIQEALSAGLALLISDQTPWRELEVHRVGWALSLENNHRTFAKKIELLHSLEKHKFQELSVRAKEFSRITIQNDKALEAHCEMFTRIIEGNKF